MTDGGLKVPLAGEALTLQQFAAIVKEVQANHRFGWQGRMIKYVTPTIDMRDDKIFHIHFRLFGDPFTFDFRDSEEPMYDRIMQWLNGGETT